MNIKFKITKEDVKLPGLEKYKAVEIKGFNINELKFNPYNDRFAMERNEYEINNKKELGTDTNSQDYIFKLLIETTAQKNKNTRNDILKNGVLKDIVVDQNGIILDGNRRVAILKKIIKDYYKPNSNLKLSNDRLNDFQEPKLVLIQKELTNQEINKIETVLQISEDEKVAYDPINMYLKIYRLYQEMKQINKENSEVYQEISDLLGPKYKKDFVKKSYDTFGIMQDYLKFFNKWGQYTYLRHKEDHFKQISAFWTYAQKNKQDFTKLGEGNADENVFKIRKILYELTCAHIEGKLFRQLVPKKAKKDVSILSYDNGYKRIQDYIDQGLKKNEKIIYYKVNRPSVDKNIRNIIDKSLNHIKSYDHKTSTKYIIKKLNENIKDLNDWYYMITSPYKVDEDVENKIYKCINKLKRIIKDYKNNGEN